MLAWTLDATAMTRILHQYFSTKSKLTFGKEQTNMNVGDNIIQRLGSKINDSVILREIANEVRDRAMHERMEQTERQMETLTSILHELRNE